MWVLPFIIVLVTYGIALRRQGAFLKKYLQVATPSALFMALPIVIIMMNRVISDGLRIDILVAVPFGAIAIAIFNMFNVRTWAHLVQIVNISVGVFGAYVTVLGVAGI